METLIKVIGAIGLVVIGLIGIALLMTYPLMWSWNYVIPKLFGLPSISPLEAFCLYMVAGSLIKSTLTSKS